MSKSKIEKYAARDASGYHSCPCRDCMEIAIGTDKTGKPSLCWQCAESECDESGNSECQCEPEPEDYSDEEASDDRPERAAHTYDTEAAHFRALL